MRKNIQNKLYSIFCQREYSEIGRKDAMIKKKHKQKKKKKGKKKWEQDVKILFFGFWKNQQKTKKYLEYVDNTSTNRKA